MMGPGVGFGGTMLPGEGIKRILRHVSFFTLCLSYRSDSAAVCIDIGIRIGTGFGAR
jgi:hypothetical protein